MFACSLKRSGLWRSAKSGLGATEYLAGLSPRQFAMQRKDLDPTMAPSSSHDNCSVGPQPSPQGEGGSSLTIIDPRQADRVSQVRQVSQKYAQRLSDQAEIREKDSMISPASDSK
eukprot:3815259-Amphidinium_carterae.1